MQPVAYLTLLLVVSAAAATSASQSQSEQVANSQSAPPQPQNVVVESSHHHQQVQAPQVGEPTFVARAPAEPHQAQQVQPSPASYYSPAGLITVVGSEQQQGVKPQQQQQVGGPAQYRAEQYGQPESASLPPNYKPFGSWGLYIGGNPADGYYTNYYKALSNSVSDKPQGVEQPVGAVKPVSGVSQTAALSPLLRQASSSPYVGGDYYPFAYSPSDLNSAARVAVDPVHASAVQSPAVLSPVQAGAQVYGSPAVFDSNYGVSVYADAYATKKVGAAYATKDVAQKEVPVVQQPAKGYQSRVYVYPQSVGQLSAPVQVGQQPQQQSVQQNQVVAYPVPIGSQIVGSQAGVDGAFAPYGVHAFTRYAVKPTVVSQADSGYYYGVQQPAYRQPQQFYSGVSSSNGPSYYPLSYYGYPMNQLHYSQGSLFPTSPVQGAEPHHVPMQPQMDGVMVEKVENEDKNKQQ